MATANPFEQNGSLMQSAFQTLNGTKPAGAGNPFQAQTDALAQGSQYQAATQDYDESKGVAGRIDTMLRSGSPLMESARTRAAQASAQRGLLNSSMAVQAGQQAMLDSAAPIAQADAQFYSQQRLANQQALNQAAAQNAQLRTQTGMEGLKLGESARQFDVGQAADTLKYGTQFGLERDKLAESQRQFNVTDSGTNSRFSAELGEKARQFNVGEANKSNLTQMELSSRERIASMDDATRRAIAQLDADTKQQVADMENNWRIELSRNEKLAGAWGTVMERIGAIQNNKDLNPETKQTLVQQNLDLFKGFAQFSQKLGESAVDVSNLLSFTTGPQSAPSGEDVAALQQRIAELEVRPPAPYQTYGWDGGN